MTMKPDHPSDKQFWFAVALVVFGCGLLIASFIINPTGEIHGSVLGAFGEILSFAGACLGFDYYNHKTYMALKRRHDHSVSESGDVTINPDQYENDK